MAMDELFKLVDCVPTPVFIMDVVPGSHPVYAHYNLSAIEKTGRNLDAIVGKTSIEVFGAEYGVAACEEQRRTILERKQRKYEYHLPMRDEVRIVRTTLSPQFDRHGTVIRLIGNPIDVSIEWVAQNAKTKLETISTEVEQFIAMAAHDLRTPMRNVMSLAELLEDGFENHGDGKLELIRMLKDTSARSMDLIADVLSYAHTLNLDSTITLYPLDEMCQSILRVLDPHGQHKIDCIPVTLSGEKNVMQIILHNLIDNALKYGDKPHLTLTCQARMLGGSTIEITVSDDGAGFDNPGRLFFETGDFLADSGYGLLAIRKLITARGGTIVAFNDPETNGSAVRFTLPSKTVDVSTASSGTRYAFVHTNTGL